MKPASVLLVDDDPDIRETMSMVLQAEGYVVETAANGAEALEKLRILPKPNGAGVARPGMVKSRMRMKLRL